MLLFLLGCIATGFLSGFTSGLFGIGGGLVVVPALTALLLLLNAPHDVRFPMALATSIACILFTSGIASLRQLSYRQVRLDLVKVLAPVLILGGLIGTGIMQLLVANWLKDVFALVMVLVAINLWRDKLPSWQALAHHPWLLRLAGFLSASLASLLGLGGGVFLVPLLRAMQVPMAYVVGTSNVCGFLVAASGVSLYLLSDNPEVLSGWRWHTSYIYWPAVAAIMVGSIPFVLLGSSLTRRLSGLHLQSGFAVLLMVVALAMVWS